jgi:hypothetical protein
MRLVPAASPEMQAAHSHRYVLTIVDILLQDRNLLRPIARLLKKYHLPAQPGLEKDLEAIRLNRSRPDATGRVVTYDHVIKLTQILHELYQQNEKKINYQRGAIVELLVRKLVCSRYGPGEFCLNNQRFVDGYTSITVEEIDVAALSTVRRQLEGYECKVSASGFQQYDCVNLKNLADAAYDKQYRVNVGFVSLENDTLMKIKLDNYRVPEPIKLYGLDSIETLQNLLF